jgi:hypothetical protein
MAFPFSYLNVDDFHCGLPMLRLLKTGRTAKCHHVVKNHPKKVAPSGPDFG